MSKTFHLVDPNQPGPSKETATPAKTDWSICFLCQEATPELLQCPAQSKRHDVALGQGYSSLAKNIRRFNELQEMPMPIDLRRLDAGSGMEANMLEHRAKWHPSCNRKFNNTKLQRAEKRHATNVAGSPAKKKFTRQSTQHQTASKEICFFCEGEKSGPLHEASTFDLNKKVRKCALDIQDQKLLAKLSAGDLIAQEAKYHLKCLMELYHKAQALESKDTQSRTDMFSKGIALAELLAYIEQARMDEAVAPVFKLADLARMYSKRLKQLGVEQDKRTHSTELKNRILSNFPDLTAHKEGRDVLLAFHTDLGSALRKVCTDNFDDEAICLARAAKIVRRDMFQKQSMFTGSFDENCQANSVPQSLLAMVAMILGGPNIKSEAQDTQASLSVAQLLQYNSCIRRQEGTSSTRHNKARETPLPIYVGLTVHARTRKRDLVETLFDLGLSVSYDRVMEISTSMSNRVCEQYHQEQVVCPPNLRQGLFTTAAIDNIDHNPSSTTATHSFHGTGISLFQHPTSQKPGTDRREHRVLEGTGTSKKLCDLPDCYTIVRPLPVMRKDVPLPIVHGAVKSGGQAILQALKEETK